ncbi:hypothetical protein K4A83_01735 [Spirulina subsalsa FACHB-351]|uniref:DUF4199 domain-containing protein n=1 Tax=Spirulina subsalsa FACHB-351 TaxID=234711 RepID=A0ABT3L0J1_9CYAN|nr:hypothetical protein [Spirulina subsalsa]MCW6034996.1 hypothetical protein [Spirulina subsalsa FACHB-351]
MKFLQSLFVFALGLGIAILLKMVLREFELAQDIIAWINTVIFVVIGFACGYQCRCFGETNTVIMVLAMSVFLYLFSSILGYYQLVDALSLQHNNPEQVADAFLKSKVGSSGVWGFYVYGVIGQATHWLGKLILWAIQLWFFGLSLFWAFLGWALAKDMS